MNLRYQNTCDHIEWERVRSLLQEGGMSIVEPHLHQKSFEASYASLFVFDGDILIGCGRIISDGVRQSAIYDIVVDSKYQGYGIGKDIVVRLMQVTPTCNFILYASPGKEKFYEKLGFRKMKTGMILFSNPERMEDENFVEL